VSAISRIAPVIAVTGLAFEARIAAGNGVTVVCSGDRQTLLQSLNEAAARGCSGIISFGTAGGLTGDHTAGCWVVATGIIAERDRYSTHLLWSRRLKQILSHAVEADIAGVDTPIADPKAKRMLHRRTGAAAVDMESHLAAQVAAVTGLPFAACRVIIDPLDRALPAAALIGLRSDGTPHLPRVFASLMRSPGQVPALIGTALDAYTARRALLRGRRLLGAGLGFPDFGQL
jgi:adenosylhomocysteine nucleosidase